MTRIAALVLAGWLLTGCAEFAARGVTLGTSLADAGQTYLNELIATRVGIRKECQRMLDNQVRELETEGKYDEARMLLSQAYPPLSIVKALDEKDASAIAEALNEARPCVVITEPQ